MLDLKKTLITFLISTSLFANNITNSSSKNDNKSICSNTYYENHPSRNCQYKHPSSCSDLGYQRQPCDNVVSFLNSFRALPNRTWNVNGSFLYYYVREDGLDTGKIILTTGPNLDNNISFLEIPFKYKPAFKVEIGSNFCHDNWSVNLSYFKYNIDRSNFISLPFVDFNNPEHYIDPYWIVAGAFLMGTFWTEAKGKWNLDTNIIDFELGRETYFGKCFFVKPFIGIRSGFIDQKYKVNYFSDDLRAAHIFYTCDSFNKSDSWLLGPRVGLKTKWRLIKMLNLFANGAISLFYQEIKVKIKNVGNESIPAFPFSTAPSYYTIMKKNNQVSSSFEGCVGLETGSHFCNKRYYASLSLSYDWEVFLNQNWMRIILNSSNIEPDPISEGFSTRTSSTADSNAGTLMLHGLDITAKIDF